MRHYVIRISPEWIMFADATFTWLITEGKSHEVLEADEQEEEEEAKNIQKRLAANLSEEDYDLNLFQVFLIVNLSFKSALLCWCFVDLCCFMCLGVCWRGQGWKENRWKRGEDSEGPEADVSEGKIETSEERLARAAWTYWGLQGKGISTYNLHVKQHHWAIDQHFCLCFICPAYWTHRWAAAPHADGQGGKDPTRKSESI